MDIIQGYVTRNDRLEDEDRLKISRSGPGWRLIGLYGLLLTEIDGRMFCLLPYLLEDCPRRRRRTAVLMGFCRCRSDLPLQVAGTTCLLQSVSQSVLFIARLTTSAACQTVNKSGLSTWESRCKIDAGKVELCQKALWKSSYWYWDWESCRHFLRDVLELWKKVVDSVLAVLSLAWIH